MGNSELGGRMKCIAFVALIFVVSCVLGTAQENAVKRPRIIGIDHVSFYTTAPETLNHFYIEVLGLSAGKLIEPGQTARYIVGKQWVGYSPAPDKTTTNRLDHIAFTTDDVVALHRYLTKKEVASIKPIRQEPDGTRCFALKDPEGYVIEFVEHPKGETPKVAAEAVSRRLIHAGFIVHDREAEDRFYREILGFRPYWHGGMKP
jgi:catechol 2,3-dioxygenase-like lactoylglutathione lyase family enzyme